MTDSIENTLDPKGRWWVRASIFSALMYFQCGPKLYPQGALRMVIYSRDRASTCTSVFNIVMFKYGAQTQTVFCLMKIFVSMPGEVSLGCCFIL